MRSAVAGERFGRWRRRSTCRGPGRLHGRSSPRRHRPGPGRSSARARRPRSAAAKAPSIRAAPAVPAQPCRCTVPAVPWCVSIPVGEAPRSRYSDCCFRGFTVALDSALAEQPLPSTTFRSWSLSSTSLALAWALASAVHLPCLPPVTVTELDADADAEADEDALLVDCTLSAICTRAGREPRLQARRDRIAVRADRGAEPRGMRAVGREGGGGDEGVEAECGQRRRHQDLDLVCHGCLHSLLAPFALRLPSGCPKRAAIFEGASIIRRSPHRFGRGWRPNSDAGLPSSW